MRFWRASDHFLGGKKEDPVALGTAKDVVLVFPDLAEIASTCLYLPDDRTLEVSHLLPLVGLRVVGRDCCHEPAGVVGLRPRRPVVMTDGGLLAEGIVVAF